MNSNSNNGGYSSQLEAYETPFSDIQMEKEEPQGQQFDTQNFTFLSEVEGPFRATYEEAATDTLANIPSAEAFTELLSELNDTDFESTLYDLATELEDTYSSKLTSEYAMGEQFVPYVTKQINQYLDPLAQETERILDKISGHFSRNNLADHNEAQIDQLFEQFEADRIPLSPAQEQFLGSIIKKAKSVVKSGINLAKKGIAAVGKILPINVILDKLKKLVRPLLDKVLKFAINKLPKEYQAHAHTLAKKFLNLETASSLESFETSVASSGDLESIQFELDDNIANLVFSQDENESEDILQNYLFSSEAVEKQISYESGDFNTPSVESARQKFIDDLKNLKQGESPVPAIENFLPAVILAARPIIKMAITVIGRPKVINFLAGLLAQLVSKYIPQNIAKPLATKIVDVGMSAIGFETYERENSSLAFEAISNTIEETIQNLGPLNEDLLEDQESFAALTLESFESAAADNFPSNYIKEEYRKSRQPGLWVLMPRKGPRYYYKKYTQVFPVTIEPGITRSIITFGGLPLSNFLKDKLGLDSLRPIQASVHIYQAINSSWLSRMSRFDNATGLGTSQPYAWKQLHPLTVKAASLLLKEPKLGKDFPSTFTKSRHKIAVGQRFFFLEIKGARLKLIKDPHKKTSFIARSSDIQGIINLIKSEIRFNYFFSEEDAKSIVEKLNRNDYLGASLTIRHSVRNVLNDLLVKNVGNKVKIVHEALPEMYLDNVNEENFAPLAAVGSIALNAGKEVLKKVVEKLVEKISELAYQAIVNYFKARAAEFKQAQASDNDGVTIKIIWINVPGMSSIRAIINAVRGKFTVGNLADLVLPNIPTPEIKIVAGKNFD